MDNDVKKIVETKPATFRLTDDDVLKFKEMASDSGLSQSEMFGGLLNTYQMDKAKSNIPDRAKEIETFQITAERLKEMFLTSLEINQTSEDRIRETLSLELKTKDQTIADLQDYKITNIITTKSLMEEIEALQGTITEGEGLLLKSNSELQDKSKTVVDQREQMDILSELVMEYKEYKLTNKTLEDSNRTLKSENLDLKNDNEKKSNELASEREQKDFYKQQIEFSKAEIREIRNEQKHQIEKIDDDHKQQILDIGAEYKQQIVDIKADHKLQISDLKYDFKADIDIAVNNAIKIKTAEFDLLLVQKNDLVAEIKRSAIKAKEMQDKIEDLENQIYKAEIHNK